ncbi:hypothetical protein BDV96DRAFT_610098 [Lophiotrema nucula]|uniref:C2H2-type domain-containing protein n=1 Tax=Lophiotrema nucula TaxID=690887 RepID=A0A6A5ZM93_9PLEO|nr:hypothetical protein BDV96DRAFT_610098 [Lophiotrema nucula]
MSRKRSRGDCVSSSEEASSSFAREASAEVKIVHLDADTAISDQPAVMRCQLPPHQPLTFTSFEEYDVHYQKIHMNRCQECQKNFPDEHFLILHIAENHDPINAAKRDRGERTYGCLVPDCDRVCSTPQKRRLHCIDKHLFPRNYDFFIVNDGIDRRSSMLRPPHRRRSSTMSSISSVQDGHRRRSSMDIVNDEQEEDKTESSEDQEAPKSPQLNERPTVTLRGRGGFGHPRRPGRGRGYGWGLSSTTSSTTKAPLETPSASASPDPVDSLTSSMSALQFVPHSVRFGKGTGRGSAG